MFRIRPHVPTHFVVNPMTGSPWVGGRPGLTAIHEAGFLPDGHNVEPPRPLIVRRDRMFKAIILGKIKTYVGNPLR
jgi:hypothetical protein